MTRLGNLSNLCEELGIRTPQVVIYDRLLGIYVFTQPRPEAAMCKHITEMRIGPDFPFFVIPRRHGPFFAV